LGHRLTFCLEQLTVAKKAPKKFKEYMEKGGKGKTLNISFQILMSWKYSKGFYLPQQVWELKEQANEGTSLTPL
jgi:DNA modification methylase